MIRVFGRIRLGRVAEDVYSHGGRAQFDLLRVLSRECDLKWVDGLVDGLAQRSVRFELMRSKGEIPKRRCGPGFT